MFHNPLGGGLSEARKERPETAVLSHLQAELLLKAKQEGKTAVMSSLDLGRSTIEARIHPDGVEFADNTQLDWEAITAVHSDRSVCFLIEAGGVRAIRAFSPVSNRTYHLAPTTAAPALIISGFTMHRIQGITPWQAAAEMVATLGTSRGSLLDTTTGLGYTSILAAKAAASVVAIELDPLTLEMARLNPWSRELFDDPKISLVMGDSTERVGEFSDAVFAAIIHDPPSLSLAGDLYSGAFYRQLFRVLLPAGRLFHYLGDPESTMGRRITAGVRKRLGEAGFRKVISKPRAFGVLAVK